jgi:hypothetical protein
MAGAGVFSERYARNGRCNFSGAAVFALVAAEEAENPVVGVRFLDTVPRRQ